MAVNSCCILFLMSIILFRYAPIFRMRFQIYEIFIRNTDNYFELLQIKGYLWCSIFKITAFYKRISK